MTTESLVQQFRGTVSPPVIYYKINEEINKSDPSLNVIGDIISEDPSLSARLLRVVNSASFGVCQRIETISEAVLFVGSKQVRDLALATTMIRNFEAIPQTIVNMKTFWLHSIAVGVAARVIAGMVGETNRERYFVGGVMHDIGRLVMFSCAPAESRSLVERALTEEKMLYHIELEEWGFSHASVGAALMAEWRLPLYLHDITAFHHAPVKAKSFPLEAAVIQLADTLAHALRYGANGEIFVPPLSKVGWERIGLSKLSLSTVVVTMEKEIRELMEPLELHTGSAVATL